MPIYTYKCSKCNHVDDYLVKMSAPTPPCTECASTEQEKQVSAGAFCLMGYGWTKSGMNSRKVNNK